MTTNKFCADISKHLTRKSNSTQLAHATTDFEGFETSGATASTDQTISILRNNITDTDSNFGARQSRRVLTFGKLDDVLILGNLDDILILGNLEDILILGDIGVGIEDTTWPPNSHPSHQSTQGE